MTDETAQRANLSARTPEQEAHNAEAKVRGSVNMTPTPPPVADDKLLPNAEQLIRVCDRLAQCAMMTGGIAGPDKDLIAAHEDYSAHRAALLNVLNNQMPTPPAGYYYRLAKNKITQAENHRRHRRHIAILMNKKIGD